MEVTTSKFYCWRARVPTAFTYTVEAGNAREAAIKAAPMMIEDIDEFHEDSILVAVDSDKDEGEIENWRVSIQRKFTLDEE